ncbi:hypothetical protein DSO57_1033597 [Entomophthora muscae]|uniref:Uncharacterized protein n=1 Tax=Entomophthora muscae TaxID=34485 RepID=A0ACC2TAR7_9FUNG|nr:hypothetical protein DSO57_1033597 [Entomophthora muscae]
MLDPSSSQYEPQLKWILAQIRKSQAKPSQITSQASQITANQTTTAHSEIVSSSLPDHPT